MDGRFHVWASLMAKQKMKGSIEASERDVSSFCLLELCTHGGTQSLWLLLHYCNGSCYRKRLWQDCATSILCLNQQVHLGK